jgi:hypothetical protein
MGGSGYHGSRLAGTIEQAARLAGTSIEDVGALRRDRDAGVAEEVVRGADVDAFWQKVRWRRSTRPRATTLGDPWRPSPPARNSSRGRGAARAHLSPRSRRRRACSPHGFPCGTVRQARSDSRVGTQRRAGAGTLGEPATTASTEGRRDLAPVGGFLGQASGGTGVGWMSDGGRERGARHAKGCLHVGVSRLPTVESGFGCRKGRRNGVAGVAPWVQERSTRLSQQATRARRCVPTCERWTAYRTRRVIGSEEERPSIERQLACRESSRPMGGRLLGRRRGQRKR